MQVREMLTRVARGGAVVVFAALVAAGCGGNDGVLGFGGIPTDSVCSVDGAGVTKTDFNRYFDNAKQQYKDNGRTFPKTGSKEEKDLKSQIIEFLIQKKIIEAQAAKYDLSVSNKDVDKYVKDLKKQVAGGDDKKFEKEMKRVHYTMAQVRKDAEFDLLSKKVYKKVVDDIVISDADAKKFYDDNPDQFKQPQSRTVAHILVPTAKKALADKIYAQVKADPKKTFAALAKKYSTDPGSASNGGELPVQKGQTVPEFEKVAFSLKTGQVSPPVKSQYGWHIIWAKENTKPAGVKKFEDEKKNIKDQLKSQKEGERYQNWNKEVRADYEKKVSCRKGYVWTQTVTTSDTAPVATTDSKKSDKKSSSDSNSKKSTKSSTTSTDKKQ